MVEVGGMTHSRARNSQHGGSTNEEGARFKIRLEREVGLRMNTKGHITEIWAFS